MSGFSPNSYRVGPSVERLGRLVHLPFMNPELGACVHVYVSDEALRTKSAVVHHNRPASRYTDTGYSWVRALARTKAGYRRISLEDTGPREGILGVSCQYVH